jgi:5-formyltetrahydrofolate cyclo-ligase
MTKDEIRAWVHEQAQRRSPGEREAASLQAQRHLLASEAYRSAGRIGCYLSTPVELQTRMILERALAEGKTLGAPRFDEGSDSWAHVCMRDPDAVTIGSWKVPEPLPGEVLEPLDLVIVPGRAFDRSGNRVGHGEGHYDQLLQGFSGICVGMAFDWQILETVPREAHDRAMDLLFTESGEQLLP